MNCTISHLSLTRSWTSTLPSILQLKETISSLWIKFNFPQWIHPKEENCLASVKVERITCTMETAMSLSMGLVVRTYISVPSLTTDSEVPCFVWWLATKMGCTFVAYNHYNYLIHSTDIGIALYLLTLSLLRSKAIFSCLSWCDWLPFWWHFLDLRHCSTTMRASEDLYQFQWYNTSVVTGDQWNHWI